MHCGAGEKTRENLAKRGITHVADIVTIGQQRLSAIVGQANGQHLYNLALGQDNRRVEPQREEKSISREQTFLNRL